MGCKPFLLIVNILPAPSANDLFKKLVNQSDDFNSADDAYWLDSAAINNYKDLSEMSEGECLLGICLAAKWTVGETDNDRIMRIAISRCKITKTQTRHVLLVKQSTIVQNELLLNELNDYLFLSLQSAERGKGFVRFEKSSRFINKVAFYLPDSSKSGLHSKARCATLPQKDNHYLNNHHPFAQCEKDIMRQFENSADKESYSSGYEEDYERIIGSKSFRRLVDKAQVFSAKKGDHYRTRMTHTQEVARIARRISTAIGANDLLTEAIALAHDIGHTPFGHQGERTLSECLESLASDNKKTDKKQQAAECCLLHVYGDFKHNLQSVRVLTKLERISPAFEGLNLSWQVVEGALWHTKVPIQLDDCSKCKKPGRSTCCKEIFFISHTQIKIDFVNRVFHKIDYASDDGCSLTLEGQIVALADEIAQRGHDIDDALSARLLSPTELIDTLHTKFGTKLLEEIRKAVTSRSAADFDSFGCAPDPESIERTRLVHVITNYFIKDAIDNTSNLLKQISESDNHPDWNPSTRTFNKRVVQLSKDGQILCSYLESIVNNEVITSQDVSSFDDTAKQIVSSLFYKYFGNPKLLPTSTLRRMALLERHNLQIDKNYLEYAFDLSNCTAKGMNKEIEKIHLAQVDCDSAYPSRNRDKYSLKRLMLARIVTDYIAGMTDSYAQSEYERICIR